MYLKTLELVGFKSFANKTRLEFEPGMTAIVGPNGCGKSNVSDAIRWVLGEQSAKVLRGSKMEDCIFNGTDDQKALNMAEVSITLADCEEALNQEFNEVTITRRVFRSGEGQYLINKTPCRLKDIHRLFMDTGIGTNSYSLMEQGRIDMILSARPDDRRAVFEEASGITKFKADKKEALRKLQHTEANLLRLDDIIREVKRRIISLQRQAGKAKRYQELEVQLRGYDIFHTREKLGQLDQTADELEKSLEGVRERDEAICAEVEEAEARTTAIRSELTEAEEAISESVEAAIRVKTELDRTQEQIRVNHDRIEELTSLSERDTKDADEARSRLAQHQDTLQELDDRLETAQEEREAAEAELEEQVERLEVMSQSVQALADALHTHRSELLDLENKGTRLQNSVTDLDTRERNAIVRRERLTAERSELEQSVDGYQSRQQQMEERLAYLQQQVEETQERVQVLNSRREESQQQTSNALQALSDLKADIAGKRGQIEVLTKAVEASGGFAAGARQLIDESSSFPLDRGVLRGALATLVDVDPAYRDAFEIAWRDALDAVVIAADADPIAWLEALETSADASVQFLVDGAAPPPNGPAFSGPGSRLAEHVQCNAELRPLIEQLLGHVYVVDHVSEVPHPLPAHVTYITRNGSMLRGTTLFEYCNPASREASAFTHQQTLATLKETVEALDQKSKTLEQTIAEGRQSEQENKEAVQEINAELVERRRNFALAEGENVLLCQESREASQRLETVTFELEALLEQNEDTESERRALVEDIAAVREQQAEHRASMEEKTEALREQEQERSHFMGEVSERKVNVAERRQEMEHLKGQQRSLLHHASELERLIEQRAGGVSKYEHRIEELRGTIKTDEEKLSPLQEEVSRQQERLEIDRQRREDLIQQRTQVENDSREKRNALDALRARKGKLEVELAQLNVRRQNTVERLAADYNISPEELASEPEPDWGEEEPPALDVIEQRITEYRSKLESMGPVNLVAIEEHRELEERYAFLTSQQQDLINSKKQLMELIRKINTTTTELFTETFHKVNANFQEMFKKLFGGGTAKLVLVDEQDILESGIEIIARPPGKKLQTVSLLSGGERTMAAVALLFSLYMVKPSPFCVLDELDAALDDANIGRFIKVLQEFLQHSQFIVITHSRLTIGAADVMYGVTMEKRGISRIVSVKFADHLAQVQ